MHERQYDTVSILYLKNIKSVKRSIHLEYTSYITREKQSYSLCKSTKICIAYTDALLLMISFVCSLYELLMSFTSNS